MFIIIRFLLILFFLQFCYLSIILILELFRFIEERQFFHNERLKEFENCTITEIPYDFSDDTFYIQYSIALEQANYLF